MASLAFCGSGVLLSAILARRKATRALPPVARRIPHTALIGAVEGENRGPAAFSPPKPYHDSLFWLRDDARNEAAVLSHLQAENEFTVYKTQHIQQNADSLYREMLSRVKETDSDVPYLWGGFEYYKRTEQGKSYSIHARKRSAIGATGSRAAGVSRVYEENVFTPHERGGVSGGDDGRSAADLGGPEQVLLDENALAEGRAMCDVNTVTPSPDHSMIAYSVDFSGYETYEIKVKRVSVSGVEECDTHLADVILNTTGDVEWGTENACIYYLTMDDAHRPNKVWRHVLGTPQTEDVCLVTENDERFWMSLSKSRSEQYIFITSSSKTSSETHAIPLQGRGAGLPHLVASRMEDVLYEVEHSSGERAPSSSHPSSSSSGGGAVASSAGTSSVGRHNMFVITTNANQAKNFKVVVAPVLSSGAEHWNDIIPSTKSIKVDGVDVFSSFWAVYGREGGYRNIWIMRSDDVEAYLDAGVAIADGAPAAVPLTRIPALHPVYVTSGSRGNMDYFARVLRFSYSSPVQPLSTCEFAVFRADESGMAAHGSGAGFLTMDSWKDSVTILKQKEVPNADPSQYTSLRIHSTSADGTAVPISLVWRPSAVKEGTPDGPPATPAPLLLYGYGSYGHSIEMGFDANVLSLCDRGIVYAVAHVRGGGEMGRAWYEDEGKLLTKRNTFSDFMTCAETLIKTGWADERRLAAQGASAGGLLMGCCLTQRPDLFRAILSQVGFVDVLLTMSDPSIPLTITEWEEWGNPNEEEYYEYMKSYSPIDNIKAGVNYPRTLLTAGLNDSRVAYWEVAKFAQRLREADANGGVDILCKVDMGAGHFSFVDRYLYLREKAFEYAWLIDALTVR